MRIDAYIDNPVIKSAGLLQPFGIPGGNRPEMRGGNTPAGGSNNSKFEP